MRYRYRGKRRSHRGMLLLLLLLTAVFLVSCVAGSNPLWIRGLFGFDAANYGVEPAEQVLAVDGEIAQELSDMVRVIALNGTELAPFRSTSQAAAHYRDAVLNAMLAEDFARYTGNTALLAEVMESYPNEAICTWIPCEDFENAFFGLFGGSSLSHKSGDLFRYLSRADGYTTLAQARQSCAEVEVLCVEETLHTYRMSFLLHAEGQESASYHAVFVKRDGGDCYFYTLEA